MAGFINGMVGFDYGIVVTAAGDNNNVAITGSLVEVIVAHDMDAITGIINPSTSFGSLIFLVNSGPNNNLVVKNQSSGSDLENQILTYNTLDLIIPPYQMAIMGYDAINLQWRVFRVPLTSVLPVADGTYTVGAKLTGGGVNGTITTEGGVITVIQEAT